METTYVPVELNQNRLHDMRAKLKGVVEQALRLDEFIQAGPNSKLAKIANDVQDVELFLTGLCLEIAAKPNPNTEEV